MPGSQIGSPAGARGVKVEVNLPLADTRFGRKEEKKEGNWKVRKFGGKEGRYVGR